MAKKTLAKVMDESIKHGKLPQFHKRKGLKQFISVRKIK